MAAPILFVTGTDTGVGKTVFAAVITKHLCDRGFTVAALKPICSGGREDARQLWKAAGRALPLQAVNPWHFRAALAPVLAARQAKRRVRLAQVVKHIHRVAEGFQAVVVEGAGGLLSPLGEGFDSRDLLLALKATPFIVCPNRLGAVGQVRLVLAALPKRVARQARVVLVTPKQKDLATKTNFHLLSKYVPQEHIRHLPWLSGR